MSRRVREAVRRLVPTSAVALVAVLAGCSTVPTTSATVQITQVAEPTDASVGVEPVAPQAGATPEEVVRGFIDASASVVRRHPIARQYLSAEAATSWSDSGGVTVISGDYAPVQTKSGTVEVTGTLVGTVDERGVFTVGTGSVFRRSFTLSEIGRAHV